MSRADGVLQHLGIVKTKTDLNLDYKYQKVPVASSAFRGIQEMDTSSWGSHRNKLINHKKSG